MVISGLVAFAVLPNLQLPEPALWLHPNGKVLIDARTFSPTISLGVKVIRTQHGATYDFNGTRSGVYFADLPQLKITESMTVSVWINPRIYVNDGPGSQILFRGDDRNGLDPYTFVIHPDGTINFSIQDENQRGVKVSAELPLRRWSQVVANWDSETGFLRMWLNGELVGLYRTNCRTFADLGAGWTPGVSVGNVQNNRGPHNQPFNGMLADLRLYRGAWTPSDIGVNCGAFEPPALKPTVTVN